MFLNKKGQTSFELAIITVFIITGSILTIGKYFEVQDSTLAMTLLKNHALKTLQEEENFYFIKKINEPTISTNTITLKIVLGTTPPDEVKQRIANKLTNGSNSVKKIIEQKTKYETVNILVEWLSVNWLKLTNYLSVGFNKPCLGL